MKREENRRSLQLATLHENLRILELSVVMLRRSLEICERFGFRDQYTMAELDCLEAFSARFARTTDLYTQRVMKSLLIVLGEDSGSFLDRARLAEKLGLIASSDDLLAVRDLRNTIAHEYGTDLTEIFGRTFELSKVLLKCISSTIAYVHSKL